eukprot:m.54203 g.54203  ORF g.54203 m.54203 type:complete len:380 (-) comp7513_c0_seq1:3422-4561(-)
MSTSCHRAHIGQRYDCPSAPLPPPPPRPLVRFALNPRPRPRPPPRPVPRPPCFWARFSLKTATLVSDRYFHMVAYSSKSGSPSFGGGGGAAVRRSTNPPTFFFPGPLGWRDTAWVPRSCALIGAGAEGRPAPFPFAMDPGNGMAAGGADTPECMPPLLCAAIADGTGSDAGAGGCCCCWTCTLLLNRAMSFAASDGTSASVGAVGCPGMGAGAVAAPMVERNGGTAVTAAAGGGGTVAPLPLPCNKAIRLAASGDGVTGVGNGGAVAPPLPPPGALRGWVILTNHAALERTPRPAGPRPLRSVPPGTGRSNKTSTSVRDRPIMLTTLPLLPNGMDVVPLTYTTRSPRAKGASIGGGLVPSRTWTSLTWTCIQSQPRAMV